jgi:hypothetical protein
MSKTLADKNKDWSSRHSTRCSTNEITTPRRAIGRRTMSSTAPILRPAAKGYSS